MPATRLASNQRWSRRIAAAESEIARFSPDWVSLQLVPYGYDRRGMLWRAPAQLKSVIDGSPLQVMFHEIWTGLAENASIKERLIGMIQRILIERLLTSLSPRIVHTSNHIYERLLSARGVRVQRLPLFGNIAIRRERADDWLFPLLASEYHLSINEDNRSEYWLIGFFGTLYPEWPPEPFFSSLRQAEDMTGRRSVIISIGTMREGKQLWETTMNEYRDRFTFLKLGYQSEERVSQLFNSLDFALPASPLDIFEKSGAAIAMLEHGVPCVFCRSGRYQPPAPEDNPFHSLIHSVDDDFPRKLMEGFSRGPAKSRVSDVSERFISRLSDGPG